MFLILLSEMLAGHFMVQTFQEMTSIQVQSGKHRVGKNSALPENSVVHAYKHSRGISFINKTGKQQMGKNTQALPNSYTVYCPLSQHSILSNFQANISTEMFQACQYMCTHTQLKHSYSFEGLKIFFFPFCCLRCVDQSIIRSLLQLLVKLN